MDYNNNNNDGMYGDGNPYGGNNQYGSNQYGGGQYGGVNPNDALFGGGNMGGGIGGSQPYYSSSYSSYSSKKSNGTGIIIAVVLVLLLAVAGYFVYNHFFAKSSYDGYYEMTKAEYMGITMEIDQLENLSGMTMEASIEIDGKNMYMEINENGNVSSGNCTYEIDGASIVLHNNGETLYGTYNEETKEIKLTTPGATLIFEKIK